MTVLAEKQFKDLDAMIKKLENYKYTYEGPHRTDGSYFLTWFKSSRTTAHKDPAMWEEICKINKNIGDKRFNDGVKYGLVLSGIAIASYHLGCHVASHIDEQLEHKKESKES